MCAKDAKYLPEKMTLFGTKKMPLVNLHFVKTSLGAICLYCVLGLNVEVWANASCDDLHRSIFVGTKEVSQESLRTAETRAVAGDLCAQSVIGRMYAEGRGVIIDWERAYTIFSDLSNKDYSPAHLNLAIHIVEKPDLELNSYLGFLVGLIAKYGSSPQHADIARGAKEIGLYILRKRLGESEEKEKYRTALQEFEFNADQAQLRSALEIVDKRRAAKERDDTIVGIIALGTAIYTARSSSVNAYSSVGSSVPTPAWMNYQGIIGPSSLYRAPAWRSYSGIIGPNILYKIR